MSKPKVQSRIYHKIYEDFHGIKIPRGMHIHHIDGDRANNTPSNLKLVSPEEHVKIHLSQGDIVCRDGKFIQGASEAGKVGGKSVSDKKKKACAENMKKNRRSDLGSIASVISRRNSKTFFFSKKYQKQLQTRLRESESGPYSAEHRLKMIAFGKSKGKQPKYADKIWNSSYEASMDTNIPASTIRYRCRKNTKGWSYDK